MNIGALLTAGLLTSGSAFADGAAPAATAAAPAAVADTHPRYAPGPGIWVEDEVRGYEALSGAADGVGVGVGYAWDLINLELQYDLSAIEVAGHHPSYVKAAADFAFITYGGFSLMGRTALSVVLDAPNCQLAPLNAIGTDCIVPNRGPMLGPEIGWGVRYRWSPKLDVYVNADADIVTADNGPRQFFFNPGLVAGIVWHPLGKEK